MDSHEERAPGGAGEVTAQDVEPWEKPIGRATFIGTLFGGLMTLLLLSRSNTVSRAVSKVTEKVKPGGAWRIYAVATPLPIFDPATYRLKITGEVENPVELTWDQVRDWPVTKNVSDFHCVTGWSVMDVRWKGILPRDIVEMVKPTGNAKYVTMLSLEEPYVDQVTMEQFMEDKNILAFELDDAPLSREQGSPLRMVIPAMYGYKGVKWVKELRFDSTMQLGYWEQRGYDVDAYIGRSNGIQS